jgi:hypothetical protein
VAIAVADDRVIRKPVISSTLGVVLKVAFGWKLPCDEEGAEV